MTHNWTNRLSEYLDGELTRPEREALEAHVASCDECSVVLEELRGVVARATSLDDRPPSRDLWAGIAGRIGTSAGTSAGTPSGAVRAIDTAPSRTQRLLGRSVTLRMPQLAAAALALMVVSGTVVGTFLADGPGLAPGVGGPGVGEPGVGGGPGVLPVAAIARLGGARYDSAVVELEQALAANRGQLDSATVRIIKENLEIIDLAIVQAQRALAADPGSVYLSNHLANTLKRKVELLRRATTLTAVQS